MTLRKSSVLTAVIAAVIFSIVYRINYFDPAEDRIYDLYLRFRLERERIADVLFLDVDDQAIAHIGVFPWPRSIMADGLLRIKEYQARAALFDIEYVDKSPAGVDEVYKSQGLPADFNRTFSEIGSDVADLVNALLSGQISRQDAVYFSGELIRSIEDQRNSLLAKTEAIARDNDAYLAQAAQLYGNTWVTLNIQNSRLEGEQAARRKRAEELFSYPLQAMPGAHPNTNQDILPPIPALMEAVRGAGFTNVIIDSDGVRRKIFLVREVGDHWYLQSALAPLTDYLGNPGIILEARRLILKNAKLPNGQNRDIIIPLDSSGAMMLDWPPTTFNDSFKHLPFDSLSFLDEYESHISTYLSILATLDSSLFWNTTYAAQDIIRHFDEAAEYRRIALEEHSDDAFGTFISIRNEGRDKLKKLLYPGLIEQEIEKLRTSLGENPAEEDNWLLEEIDYVEIILQYLTTEFRNLEALDETLRNYLPDKFCIIGRVDTGTTDIGVNPFHGQYVNVGTHGVVLDTILTESFINVLPFYWSILATLILTPLVILFLTGFKPVLRTILGIIGIVIFIGSTLLFFRFKGIFLGPLGPVLAMITAVIVREIIAYVGSEHEKQFIRKAFSTYLSGDVVHEILNHPEQLHLGGREKQMTAVFTDIRSFTSIAERLNTDPVAMIRLLNRYLSAMSDILLEQKGTIDKYEGDAIIAFFGAPLDLPDHALRACESAIAMKQKELELNQYFMENNLSPMPLLTRIGINTGNMVVGNMGTERKMNYTIMGHEVNLAARLEQVNKQYGTWIMVSDKALRETGGGLLSRRLDRVRVVGIQEPVQLHELLNIKNTAPPEQRELVELYSRAMDIYETKNWTAARDAFQTVLDLAPEDGPASLYQKRCETYCQTPPPDDWDGVINLTQK
jgi:adenylate cyclase